MLVDDLNLVSYARDAAMVLQAQCPYVVFTSGRRDWYGQAHAMAANVLKVRKTNPQWVGRTYAYEPQFQAWMDAHPEEASLDVIAAAFFEIANALPNDLRMRFAHPAGRAFDCEHDQNVAQQREIEARIALLPRLEWWTPNESGVLVNHAQFSLHGEV